MSESGIKNQKILCKSASSDAILERKIVQSILIKNNNNQNEQINDVDKIIATGTTTTAANGKNNRHISSTSSDIIDSNTVYDKKGSSVLINNNNGLNDLNQIPNTFATAAAAAAAADENDDDIDGGDDNDVNKTIMVNQQQCAAVPKQQQQQTDLTCFMLPDIVVHNNVQCSKSDEKYDLHPNQSSDDETYMECQSFSNESLPTLIEPNKSDQQSSADARRPPTPNYRPIQINDKAYTFSTTNDDDDDNGHIQTNDQTIIQPANDFIAISNDDDVEPMDISFTPQNAEPQLEAIDMVEKQLDKSIEMPMKEFPINVESNANDTISIQSDTAKNGSDLKPIAILTNVNDDIDNVDDDVKNVQAESIELQNETISIEPTADNPSDLTQILENLNLNLNETRVTESNAAVTTTPTISGSAHGVRTLMDATIDILDQSPMAQTHLNETQTLVQLTTPNLIDQTITINDVPLNTTITTSLDDGASIVSDANIAFVAFNETISIEPTQQSKDKSHSGMQGQQNETISIEAKTSTPASEFNALQMKPFKVAEATTPTTTMTIKDRSPRVSLTNFRPMRTSTFDLNDMDVWQQQNGLITDPEFTVPSQTDSEAERRLSIRQDLFRPTMSDTTFDAPHLPTPHRSEDNQQLIPIEEVFQPGGEMVFESAHFDFLQSKGTALTNNCRNSLLLRFDPLVGHPVPAITLATLPAAVPEVDVNDNDDDDDLKDFFIKVQNPLTTLQTPQSSPKSQTTTDSKSNISVPNSTISNSSNSFNSEQNVPNQSAIDTKFLNSNSSNERTINHLSRSPLPPSPVNIKQSNSPNIQSTVVSQLGNATMSVGIIEKMSENDCQQFQNSIKNEESHVSDGIERKIKHENIKFDDIEKKLREAEAREEATLKRITEKDKIIAKMTNVLEEYEKTIAESVAEKERQIGEHEKKTNEINAERDMNAQHLASLEVTFSDLHVKYERSKQITLQLKEDKDKLLADMKTTLEQLSQQEQRYNKMRNHAMQQLEIANTNLETMGKNHAAEITRLKACLKKEEISKQSFSEQLNQKTKENAELVKICDELINGQGSQ